ncbi:MAG: potassium channel family protein [Elainellaceae cyanobacterium]
MIGYVLFGWTVSDAFYMVIITIFGVGYGEVQPLETPAERFFTILLMNPGPSYVICGGDTLILMAHRGDIPQLAQLYRLKQTLRYRGARA